MTSANAAVAAAHALPLQARWPVGRCGDSVAVALALIGFRMRSCQRRLAAALALAAWLGGAPAVRAQTLVSTGALSFGAFVAGTGGTIAVSTAGGRSKTGGVLLMPQGGGTAAQFTVSGTAGAIYAITLPVNGTVTLSDGNNHTMALNNFVSDPNAAVLLSGGTQWLRVGATLSVGPTQAPGHYSGAFAVTVHYN
ncbi:MAG: DUF4402 domain-containing protein [Pseudomonadota bacterium]|nr:DUF4402 domain-containing protein [Pseudomonadota bacterium]